MRLILEKAEAHEVLIRYGAHHVGVQVNKCEINADGTVTLSYDPVRNGKKRARWWAYPLRMLIDGVGLRRS